MTNNTDEKAIAEEAVVEEAVVEEAVVEEAVVDNAEATAPASLTVQDLANLRNIIDVASQRGAFRTNEFSAIGEAYTKLNDFIIAIAPPKVGGQEEAEGTKE